MAEIHLQRKRSGAWLVVLAIVVLVLLWMGMQGWFNGSEIRQEEVSDPPTTGAAAPGGTAAPIVNS